MLRSCVESSGRGIRESQATFWERYTLAMEVPPWPWSRRV